MALFEPSIMRANFPEMYERVFVQSLFRPFADELLRQLELRSGDSVLDVACGTGIVARLAKEQLGPDSRVVGVDLNAPMLAVAADKSPGVEFRQGNASALPVPANEQFSVVTCHQGLQFFPDRQLAAREMRRVLSPGGRLAAATWRPLADVPFIRALQEVAERHLGPVEDERHSFGNAAELKSLFLREDFRDVQVQTVARSIWFADGAALVRMNAMGLISMSAGAAGYNDETRGELASAIVNDSVAVLNANSRDGQLAFDLATNMVMARAAT